MVSSELLTGEYDKVGHNPPPVQALKTILTFVENASVSRLLFGCAR